MFKPIHLAALSLVLTIGITAAIVFSAGESRDLSSSQNAQSAKPSGNTPTAGAHHARSMDIAHPSAAQSSSIGVDEKPHSATDGFQISVASADREQDTRRDFDGRTSARAGTGALGGIQPPHRGPARQASKAGETFALTPGIKVPSSLIDAGPTHSVPGTPGGIQAPNRGSAQPATQASEAEETFELAPGEKVPASLVDVGPTNALSPEQEPLRDNIASEFIQAVKSGNEVSASWDRAQVSADARFRILFGEITYQRHSIMGERVSRGLAE